MRIEHAYLLHICGLKGNGRIPHIYTHGRRREPYSIFFSHMRIFCICDQFWHYADFSQMRPWPKVRKICCRKSCIFSAYAIFSAAYANVQIPHSANFSYMRGNQHFVDELIKQENCQFLSIK